MLATIWVNTIYVCENPMINILLHVLHMGTNKSSLKNKGVFVIVKEAQGIQSFILQT
jgi:hypothetical protein